MNSILQALTHCGPFLALINAVRENVIKKIHSNTPILDALIEFIGEMTSTNNDELLTPNSLYNILQRHPKFAHLKRGQQEDAQEFLGMLLECLDEEFMIAAPSGSRSQSPHLQGTSADNTDDDDESWVEVGKRNRPLTVRHAGRNDSHSPINKLFGGRFKSILTVSGSRSNPSLTYDPFQHVQLDISDDCVTSVQEALDKMSEPEGIQYSTPKGNDVHATKQVTFDILPRVLIVHLKRFTFAFDSFSTDLVQKITKPVEFTSKLHLAHSDGRPRPYRLFAVVYHHGPSATVGHYTVDVETKSGWVSIDDVTLTKISEPGTGTEPAPSKSAYLLFYILDHE
jgi:ubiquitin carboxyl-terminal hydrolase 10